MMFAQINSEHCRHKIFNARFTVDGTLQRESLFDLIRVSTAHSPARAAQRLSRTTPRSSRRVVGGALAGRRRPALAHFVTEALPILMKVETHNHPTGISPHPGAGTGAGGEIRDEAATGRGGKPKAGLCVVLRCRTLRIPGFVQPWEFADSHPPNMATPLAIMIDGPLGAAAYNNEFGRPNLCGYFRSFEARLPNGQHRGYHKPVMLAGGFGQVRQHVTKQELHRSAPCWWCWGASDALIGLGGGAASSMATGTSSAELDYASVQRANPELQRRCQEVIDACTARGEDNPILSIHDVGAGGLSNAMPELIDADGRGGRIRLRAIQSADPSLSPMEIWCNEAQGALCAGDPQRFAGLARAAVCARTLSDGE